jgi:hypothetical protein
VQLPRQEPKRAKWKRMFRLITNIVLVSALIAVTTIVISTPTASYLTPESKQSNRMKIIVGKKTFDAVLFDNPTAGDFKKLLPLTLSMSELNDNEKYADLPKKITINPSHPGQIKAGDLMMYGSTTIVLFYKPLQTSYSYTPLGRIEDISSLAEAVGRGNITVSFKLE